MKKRILGLLAALGVAAITTAASAAQMADGVVGETDLTNNRLVLTDGEVFKLGTGLGASQYSPGDHVVISWEGFDDKGFLLAYQITKIAADQRSPASSSMAPSSMAPAVSDQDAAATPIDPDRDFWTLKHDKNRVR
jgi:hypothetical protein